jgi:hypothetical protein
VVSRTANFCIDAHDPRAQVAWWAQVLCLRPVDRSRDEEVERLLGLGARMVDDLRTDETGWAVLADPEGNEFCVLATRADVAGVARQ